MSNKPYIDESLKEIISQLNQTSPNIKQISKLVHNYNKSLGITLKTIRKELYLQDNKIKKISVSNFLKVIKHIK